MSGTCRTQGDVRHEYTIFVRKVKERDHLEDFSIDGRIVVLEWVVKKYGVRCELDSSGSDTVEWRTLWPQ
jgi:hypothetical protein